MIRILKNQWEKRAGTLLLLTCITLLTGCAVISPRPPVTVAEVIQMSKEGVPTESIISKMRDSESVYPLTAAQLSELHDVGVANRVLNYMQQTYIDEERQQQIDQDWGDAMWPPYSF